ncbi:hypothetical protein ERX46_08235 [Brumimicrobium glaciale]|uniref:Uncharacterized protein n=1 Tax=Brumimicrobium glaciale TaxID=200475 RepID=A0A4Q4KNE5_9FLAO|nr:hypothetical protein [Brumimicrobium glaciale]RYM33944.1 hypothetical protein ERX46_08235 [Brumimicrobium glaciale]
MKTPEFDFKKHQNFSRNRKMIVRFLIYSVVISMLMYLIYDSEDTKENTENEEKIDQIDVERDEIINYELEN